MTNAIPIAKLRRRILDTKRLTPQKHTKTMLTEEELPDLYPKSDKMKYIEAMYQIQLERVVLSGSLNQLAKRFNYEIDRSTLSRWRKLIKTYLGLT